ncbi:hypothetical protein GGS24DRAFT_455705 [Hypoxylon argillaceum]|nr:hypothetical protein GGS24DRAFT_455705 [Hypoxylon argillaceum]
MEIGAGSEEASQTETERTERHNAALSPRSTPRSNHSATKQQPIVRRRKTPICLLILYIPTLVVPWVLIVVTSWRTSLLSQTHIFLNSAGAVIAARLLNSINGVLAVPIISALLAHAAVVYAMRRQHGQKLNVQQLFALADKGWSNVSLLWNARSKGKSSRFLWLAALLIFLGAILQPLMSVLIPFESGRAPTAQDNPIRYPTRASTVGYDPEPADMPLLSPDLVLRDVVGRLTTLSDLEPQRNIWPSDTSSSILPVGQPLLGQTLSYYSSNALAYKNHPRGFFVTAVDSGVNTGVLREHILRLNSSVECEYIKRSSIPSPCPGAEPFETHVSRPGLELSVCAPGNSSQFPFTASRNRQDIVEELFIDLVLSSNPTFGYFVPNVTLHCTASTSRGYFELPNEQNKYVAGPLLDEWPSPEYILKNTDDYRGLSADYARPTVEDPSLSYDDVTRMSSSAGQPFGSDSYYKSTPGPLMVSAQALFGNYSFVQWFADNVTEMTPLQAYASVCEHGSIPFSQIEYFFTSASSRPIASCFNAAGNIQRALSHGPNPIPGLLDDLDSDLTLVLATHVGTFNDTDIAKYALEISMYLANRAILVHTALNEQILDYRSIYFSPGSVFQRPIVNTPSLVVITILIAAQLLGLVLVAILTYSVPTWTSTLGALEVTQIGRALPIHDWAPIGQVTPAEKKRLNNIDALIGVDEGQGERGGHRAEGEEYATKEGGQVVTDGSEGTRDSTKIRLALGGKGLITRDIIKQLNSQQSGYSQA